MGNLKKKVKTVRGKLFLILCITVISIIVFLIVVNKFVLEKYYQYIKSNSLKTVYSQINDYYGDTRTIDSHVKKIRHKLGKKGKYIKTIRGIGYKFEVK